MVLVKPGCYAFMVKGMPGVTPERTHLVALFEIGKAYRTTRDSPKALLVIAHLGYRV